MDINNLKYVVGKVETDKPAVIRFFGPVDSWSAYDFNCEFLWLQNEVKPSKIIVLINSEGGSVINGMSCFSVIQSCPIDVDGVIEGIAASMGSVIWAACKRLYMHDYSILMIHNPFCHCEEDNEDTKAMISAFRQQIETIYCKRFGLSKETVKQIMDGEGEVDGTYLSAKEAAAKGIISADHIIKTTKTVRDEIKAKIDGVTDAASLREIMAVATSENFDKLTEKATAILEKNDEQESINQNTTMDNKQENPLFGAVVAQLGLSEDSQLVHVSNRISELVKAENEKKEIKAQLDALQIKYTGKETEVTNLSEKLADVEAKLKQYQDAEAAAHQAAIEAMVDNAIATGRIKDEVKSQWVKMAQADFETVKNTLDSIPAREKVTEEIANDKQNRQDAQDNKSETEKELEAQIKAAIGENFEFKKLED